MALEKRLNRELHNITTNPPDGITAGIDEDDLQSWSASIAGPGDSPYAGGIFFLHISYPSSYPAKPPTITFRTPVYHPNINSIDGTVFVNILGDDWCPALTAEKLLLSIQSLLINPNPHDSVDPQVGQEYINNREQFDKTAKEWTERYAMG